MPSNEATPFTLRQQLEKDTRRAIEQVLGAALNHYKPNRRPEPVWPAKMQVSRAINQPIGDLVVRVRIEIAGKDVEADWIEEAG